MMSACIKYSICIYYGLFAVFNYHVVYRLLSMVLIYSSSLNGRNASAVAVVVLSGF